jgi:SAM-dependent methyltransferase
MSAFDSARASAGSNPKELLMQAADGARERNRAIWASGNWDGMADDMAAAGPRLLDRIADVGPGVALLDVGTGSGGSVAIPAAQRGADVAAADITDAWFPAARRRAQDAGVDVRWVVGDAAELPFEDGRFDVVTSTFGHMFAPDQQAAAREVVRVCRPGGTLGLCCWTPQGNFGQFIARLVMLTAPLPEGFRPPVLWGSEPHVRELLEPLGVTLDMRRTTLRIAFASVAAQVAAWEADLGPMVTVRAAIGEARWAAARDELLTYFEQINERDDGTMAAEYEYLEIVGRVG